MAFDPYLPAIKTVLAAYRSTDAHITEEQIQAAWEEFAAIAEEHPTLARRKKWPPGHVILAADLARRLAADGLISGAVAHEVEQALVDEQERFGERLRRERARLYVAELRRLMEGPDAA